MHDHCGPMNSKSEMMKAWDGPGGHADRGESRFAGRIAKVGGQKREAGAQDLDEMK